MSWNMNMSTNWCWFKKPVKIEQINDYLYKPVDIEQLEDHSLSDIAPSWNQVAENNEKMNDAKIIEMK